MWLRSDRVKMVFFRTMIGLFGLACFMMVAVVVLFAKEPDAEEWLRNQASRIEKKPTAMNIRPLLVEPSDGAHAYLQMALVGRVFAWHPTNFRRVALKLEEGSESAQVERLANFGAGVFEYYPELQPPEFERVYAKADWLQGFRNGE